MIRVVLDGRLPGLNELIGSVGRPWWACRRTKRDAMNRVMMELMAQNIPPFKRPIVVRIKWIEKDARRDRDNVSSGGTKILLDAMKQRGLIRDDSRRWVKDIRHDTSVIDKQRPRIEIEIEEVS